MRARGLCHPARRLSSAFARLWSRRLEVVDLPTPSAHLYVADQLYGDQVRAQQLVYVDDRGHWPWDRGFRSGRGGQPVLGPRASVTRP